ncbi:hypothetical protein H9P43_001211 [Blastocladiella emersonii ATCC 22665]|nr:hypothetical protein H9P43_001211 [Blastocladiella emersonii ATCC 22665]
MSVSLKLDGAAANPIRIEAHFIPFCEEAVDALDGAEEAGTRCASAMSHANALAFASSVRYWKLREVAAPGNWAFAPSCVVKNLAGAGLKVTGSGKGGAAPAGGDKFNFEYDADIRIQVRSDWDGWYFESAASAPTRNQMDIRITMTHELLHGFGVSFTGLDSSLIPGLTIPWHFGPSGGYWTNWTDVMPWYLLHMVDATTKTPVTDLVRAVQAWQPKSRTVRMDDVVPAMQRDAPAAYAAAQKLQQLLTTPRALAIRTGGGSGDFVYVDTSAANVTGNSAVHLDSATYGAAADDAILVLDTGSYMGRPWNATLGPVLAATMAELGFPRDDDARNKLAAAWTATTADATYLGGQRIDVMQWKWNWVKNGSWTLVNVLLILPLTAAWVALARQDWRVMQVQREWFEMRGSV